MPTVVSIFVVFNAMKERVVPGGKYRIITAGVVVLGSGAAALNGAVRLRRMGVDDVVVVTEKLGAGTSAGAGSDKQTYYRLNPSGRADNAVSMAEDLARGGCMHGDIALVEANLSQQAFHHLVNLGVPFPHDRYGDYTGYITDHDPVGRGTSAGPETSIMMYRALLQEAKLLNIPILEDLRAVELFIRPTARGKCCRGFAALRSGGMEAPRLTVFETDYLLLATGGPADLFRDSVYPRGQRGSLGLALAAGVRFQNISEFQFGIASTAFRWNLSGSYQQVLPRYFSTEQDGSDVEDFLAAFFPDARTMLTAQFLKGYQWPFDIRRVNGYGSSVVDLLIYFERSVRGRRVFIDYRRNPRYPGFTWNREHLPDEARDYLLKSGALGSTPIKRLREMNNPAYELFLKHGIDLETDPIEIAVCHQHLNGGIVPTIWWESSIRGLFAAGECAGTHGIYRPGGSALNAGQAGSYRAAECIAHRYQTGGSEVIQPGDRGKVIENLIGILEHFKTEVGTGSPETVVGGVRERMSENCGIFRNSDNLKRQLQENARALAECEQSFADSHNPDSYFHTLDLLLTERAVVVSALDLLERLSGSRGSFIHGDTRSFFRTNEKGVCTGLADVVEDRALNGFVQETVLAMKTKKVSIDYRPVRPIPMDKGWYEEVRRTYKSGRVFEV